MATLSFLASAFKAVVLSKGYPSDALPVYSAWTSYSSLDITGRVRSISYETRQEALYSANNQSGVKHITAGPCSYIVRMELIQDFLEFPTGHVALFCAHPNATNGLNLMFYGIMTEWRVSHEVGMLPTVDCRMTCTTMEQTSVTPVWAVAAAVLEPVAFKAPTPSIATSIKQEVINELVPRLKRHIEKLIDKG